MNSTTKEKLWYVALAILTVIVVKVYLTTCYTERPNSGTLALLAGIMWPFVWTAAAFFGAGYAIMVIVQYVGGLI